MRPIGRFLLICLLRPVLTGLRNKNENQDPAFGCLLSQDLSYKSPKQNITLSLLYALFDVDSYNERIYSYENDVQYSYSIPAYYGKGIRSMILAGVGSGPLGRSFS